MVRYTMWKICSIFVLGYIVCTSALPSVDLSIGRITTETIASHGYPVERHHVTTQDGYILEMHRIPSGPGQDDTADRPVVFLMHGLLSASHSFIAIGPEYGMGYNLADAGFDVWMGNARGNSDSRNHVSLDPDDEAQKFQFFDFSFEEIGEIDVATMVDYVLAATGKSTLHYIGHSQGGTAFLVLASLRPDYNEKFRSAHLLAAVGYQEYQPNTQFVQMAALTDFIYAIAVADGMVEIFPPDFEALLPNSRTTSVIDNCGGTKAVSTQVCKVIGLDSLIPRNDNDTVLSEFVSGAAIKQIAHYGQNIRDKAFRRWHYGNSQNQEIYGGPPPAYDLGLITTNVTMHYTLADNLLDERDVLAMAADMPNTVVRMVARTSFLHEDFVLALDSKELVTDYIIEAIISLEAQIEDGEEEVEEVEEQEKEEEDQEEGAEEQEEGAEEQEEAEAGEEENEENVPEVEDGEPDAASSIVLSSLLKSFVVLYSLKLINALM